MHLARKEIRRREDYRHRYLNPHTSFAVYRKSIIRECFVGQRRITETDLHAIKDQTDKLVANKQLETIHA